MLLIANTTTVASRTDPISPAHMASTSQTASGNWQAMTAQPKLQKSRCDLLLLAKLKVAFFCPLRLNNGELRLVTIVTCVLLRDDDRARETTSYASQVEKGRSNKACVC